MSAAFVTQRSPRAQSVSRVGRRQIHHANGEPERARRIDGPGIRTRIRTAPLDQRRDDFEVRRLDPAPVFRREETVVQIADQFLERGERPLLIPVGVLQNGLRDVEQQSGGAFARWIAFQNLGELGSAQMRDRREERPRARDEHEPERHAEEEAAAGVGRAQARDEGERPLE